MSSSSRLPANPRRCRQPWPTTSPATTGRDRLRRPWLKAAWTIDDVMTALDQHPITGARPHAPLTDTPARGRGAVRNPAGWLLSRLRDWTHPDATPLTPPRRPNRRPPRRPRRRPAHRPRHRGRRTGHRHHSPTGLDRRPPPAPLSG